MKRTGKSKGEGQRGKKQNDGDRHVLTEREKRRDERDVWCQTEIER